MKIPVTEKVVPPKKLKTPLRGSQVLLGKTWVEWVIFEP